MEKQAVPLLPVAYRGGAGFHAAEHGGAGAESDREGAKVLQTDRSPHCPVPLRRWGGGGGRGRMGGKIFLSPYSESVLPITRTVE